MNCDTCGKPKIVEDDQKCFYKMQDGRHFTNYNSRCMEYALARKMNNVKSSYDMRKFLVGNAEKIMEENRMYSVNKNACGKCDGNYKPNDQGTMLPELDRVICNERYCDFKQNDKNGLGTGISR